MASAIGSQPARPSTPSSECAAHRAAGRCSYQCPQHRQFARDLSTLLGSLVPVMRAAGQHHVAERLLHVDVPSMLGLPMPVLHRLLGDFATALDELHEASAALRPEREAA